MEKPANKFHKIEMTKKIQLLLLFVLTLPIGALAQTDFEKGKKYILGDVEVTGNIKYSPQTVITFAGLEKGQDIVVPGEDISQAIKKLWKLGFFSDVNFYVNEIKGDSIFLELNLNELPKLADVKVKGLKKGKSQEVIKEAELKIGKIVNENLITTTKNYIEKKFRKKGFYNTKVNISTTPDTIDSQVKMVVQIDRGSKVKISEINFEGNDFLSDKKLRGALKKTKRRNPIRIYKASKFIEDDYDADLKNLLDKYKEKGYRDARIVEDKVEYNKEKNSIAINIKVEEGRKYYFGDIRYLGNTVYTDQQLGRLLGVSKGDVYNGVLLQKRIADQTKPDGEDITNLYQNNGYLFSTINPVEISTANDTIDFEIRINEGPIAYFNKITVSGNDRTNDHVIYRELRTKPGEKYSKDDLIRSVREIGQMGYFDPESIDPQFKNVDAQAGTVDINFKLAEKGSSQIELQGGYGGGGFIGTLGLSFNNFSMRNLFNKKAYKPVPMGDGQSVALRLQGSTFFQTYSLNFSEPWFGGKKPISFNTSLSHSKQFRFDSRTRDVNRSQGFNITSLSVGIAKRLTVPDDFFVLSQNLSFQYYDLNNYNVGLFTFGDGTSRNLSYTVALSRNSKGTNPIFPMYGSEFSISGRFTPPYSLFNGVDYANLGGKEEYKYIYNGSSYTYIDDNGISQLVNPGDYLTEVPSANNPTPTRADNVQDAAADQGKIDQKRFNWLEYYKIKVKGDWYTNIYDKLVLRTLGEFGYMGAYDQSRGLVPFERFYVGGDGLANFQLDGREVIQLRGYPNNSLSSNNGGTVYNKFSLELRYPITLNQSASIYALSFFEAGASYDNFKNYNPFKMQRSAGVGLRVFMPQFGLLGIDFANGFDPVPGETQKSGWQTHFIIGQQF